MRGVGGDSPGGEYERHRLAVLGMLAKRFPRFDEDERLAIYHDAWARVLSKRERGERIASLRAYLLATSGAEALSILSRGRVPTPVAPDDSRLATLSDDSPPVDEQVVIRDEARIARRLLDTLDERQRNVLKLRWDLQLSGREVRAALGLTERQYRRLAEEGAAALAERVEELDSGQWSRRTRSLLVACLVEVTRDGERRTGIASHRQRAEAQRLLESDPHVAALYAEVRRSVRGVAALLPLPVFVASPSIGAVDDLAQLASDLRSHLADAIEVSKQHAISLYIRTANPSLMASAPRPGAAFVAIASVLAVGGGAYGFHEATSTSTLSPGLAPAQSSVTAPTFHQPAPTFGPKRAAKHKPLLKPEHSSPEPAAQAPVVAPDPNPVPASAQPIPTPPQPTEFGFED